MERYILWFRDIMKRDDQGETCELNTNELKRGYNINDDNFCCCIGKREKNLEYIFRS